MLASAASASSSGAPRHDEDMQGSMQQRAQRRVIRDEIEVDMGPATVIQGPPSISQHTTCKIHCSNPDDFSRVQSFQHFQEYVVGVTKEGLHFVAQSLEKMFPENAIRTKVLLGSFSAMQLLKEHGASVSTQASGSVLRVPLETLSGGFQDPYFICDPPTPMPPLPSPLANMVSVSSPSAIPAFAPKAPSGLIIGANVKGGVLHTVANGTTVWDALSRSGSKPFFYGLAIGFVDEFLSVIVPRQYIGQLNYIKNLIKSAASIIGTSVLIHMIINKQTSLKVAMTTVLISYVCNIVGGTVGIGLGKLLGWVKSYCFDETKGEAPPLHLPLPVHVDLRNPFPAPQQQFPDLGHCCGQEDNGFMHIGLCIRCNDQPAVFGFVHSKDDVAHSAFCLPCSALYQCPTCVCCAEVSSTYYFSPDTPICNMRTCIAVAQCVACDEEAVEVPKTANVWRVKKAEETKISKKTVTLDVRYCLDHWPAASARDAFRYGKLYSMGM